jgi:SPP1 gp7 family putative phage head morphogenesis protein
MIALKENYYSPVYKTLKQLFFEIYYRPLLQLIDLPNVKLNASETAIIEAIKSGRVQYKDGVFSGQFNISISRELATFATFDKRSNVWRGQPGPMIKAAAIMAESKRIDLQNKMNQAIDEAQQKIIDQIDNMYFGNDLPLFAMGDDIADDLKSIGVMPEIDERTEKALRKDYTTNMRLNIVDENNPGEDWNSKQVERLREMVKQYQTTGTNTSLIQLIQSEWDTSASKARFLASQETRLFLGTLSRDRAKRTGVRRYRWSTSHDERVREDHKLLQGTIVDLDSPGPIVDRKTGRRAHAGEDFGCRCAKIWVLE